MPFDKEIIKRPLEDNDDEDTDREWELRDALPADRDPNNKPSIWKVLKDLIGKDFFSTVKTLMSPELKTQKMKIPVK